MGGGRAGGWRSWGPRSVHRMKGGHRECCLQRRRESWAPTRERQRRCRERGPTQRAPAKDRHKKGESGGARHTERRGPTQRALGDAKSAGPMQRVAGECRGPDTHPDTESERAQGPERGKQREGAGARRREHRAPTHRALKSAGARRRERWRPTERAPGLDAEGAGPRGPRHRERA